MVFSTSSRYVVVATIVCVLLSGCLITTAAKDQLVVWHWEAHARGDFAKWLEYAKLSFEKSHPEVEVTYEYVPFGPDRMVIAASANVVPDVSIASAYYARDLYESGLLQPVNELYAATPDLERNLLPVTQLFNQHEGVIYGATNSLEARAILYNHQQLAEAGLDNDPLAIKTWDDFSGAVRKLTRFADDGKVLRAGYFEPVNKDALTSWLYSNGASFSDEAQTRAVFNTDKGRQTLTFQRDLWNLTGAVSGFSANFAQGNVSMQLLETAVGHIPGIEPAEFGYTSVPTGPAGTSRGSVAWGNMYVIPAGAKHPQLAWDWIVHYTSLESQIKQLEICRMPISPRRDLYSSSAWRAMVSKHPHMSTALDIFQLAGAAPFYRGSAIDKEINPILRKVFTNKVAPEAAMEQMESIVNRLLAR
jgi:multiple sugar transport system substrate-binding protein